MPVGRWRRGEWAEVRPGSKLLFTFSHVANISQLPRAILSSKLSKQPPGVLYWHSLSWLLADYTHTHDPHTPTRIYTLTPTLGSSACVAGPLRLTYIYTRGNHCSRTLAVPVPIPPTLQHVYVSSYTHSFLLETCLPRSTILYTLQYIAIIIFSGRVWNVISSTRLTAVQFVYI